jgi:cytochrome c peroxidase
VNGKLSRAAERGKQVFFDGRTGCASCHPAGLFTDLKGYDVGTRGASDSSPHFDTPTLVELWRTAPYLHDGSAATLEDVIVSNTDDRHGRTSHLAKSEIDDLIMYLRSL